MSRSAKVTAAFGGGRHDFRLGIAQLDELEEATGFGYRAIHHRIRTGAYRVREVRETLRLGLIGAGMAPVRALALVDRYAAPGMLVDAEPPAMAVLMAAMVGSEDDQDEDDDAGEMKGGTAAPGPETSPTDEPTGP